MGRFFGTDGIRGKADQFKPDFIGKIALGLKTYAGRDNFKVLLGGDTRESTEWILRDFERALSALGVEYGNAGVLPTPGINYAFYDINYDYAIDVTASHNPYVDNGVKLFERGEKYGVKLSDDGVAAIEKSLGGISTLELSETEITESLHEDALDRYLEHLHTYVRKFGAQEVRLDGMKIGLDCANGAVGVVAEKILAELGAEVTVINALTQYGRKINDGVGSTHIERLQELVRAKHLDMGAAFDGDGDRCLMVDVNGEIVDGDKIIVLLADFLNLPSVAVTVMANQGLFKWAEATGVEVETTDVGDQNVAKAMQEHGIVLGGEQSGHIILPGEAMGDGMLTALVVAKVVAATGKDLGELASVMQSFPQVIYNLPATRPEKAALKKSAAQAVLARYEQQIAAEGGRMLVRPSGTEDLVRITLWGEDVEKIKAEAKKIAADLAIVIKEENGKN